jgi:hypothetical protein
VRGGTSLVVHPLSPELEVLVRKHATGSRLCKGCGERKPLTPRGHIRAHRCPHGAWCVPPYLARRQGVRGKTCGVCLQGRQLVLFPVTP